MVKKWKVLKHYWIEIDWSWISNGKLIVRFHGDLHFENILVPTNNNFHTPPYLFVDWRQDFCGDLKVGDIYYDFENISWSHYFSRTHRQKFIQFRKKYE